MSETQFDIIVIGGGPGGYVAAIKAAQLGFKTACIDKRSTLGGTCLNVGCIPSKALLHSSHLYHEVQYNLAHHGIKIDNVALELQTMIARKDKIVNELTAGIAFLFKKNGVTFIQGTASFTPDKNIVVNDKTYIAKHIIIATGSAPTSLPGIEVDEQQIVSSTGALNLSKVPDHLIIVGGGYIGLELGSVWQRLGAKVTVIEYADRITPGLDHEMGQALYKSLTKQGLNFILNSKVNMVTKSKRGVQVTLTNNLGNETMTLEGDIVLSCAGRKPFTNDLNLSAIGIDLEPSGCIAVDGRYQTAQSGVYAIGDVIKGPMLAHKAEEEGVTCVEMIAGQQPHMNYDVIPAVVYTHPEVASVGQSEQQLKHRSVDYKIGKFPFAANARAKTTDTIEGFVKVLSNTHTDEILGVHIIHPEAGTLIGEATLAMEYRASAEDLARTIHAHPTTNEALKEAAMAAYSKALHI